MTQIIIVDDEVEILAPLEQMLTQEGYHVSAFSSSLAAQAHLQQHSVDLALFD
ncbi:response regulator, partial [Planktomarina temperata]